MSKMAAPPGEPGVHSQVVPNAQQASDVLGMFCEGDEHITIQVLSDNQRCQVQPFVRHGAYYDPEVLEELIPHNRNGAGIFFAVNSTDGEGRKKKNIIRVRAIFVDLDDAPLEPVLTGPLEPHIIVETSPGRYHAYWLVDGVSLDEFTPIQKALAKRFGGDESVHDLPRVMRVPWTLHNKGEPFLSKVIELNKTLPYTRDQVLEAFEINLAAPEVPQIKKSLGEVHNFLDTIPEGQRNDTLFRYACGLVGRGLKTIEVRTLLMAEAQLCNPPLPENEIKTILQSAEQYRQEQQSSNTSLTLFQVSDLLKNPPPLRWQIRDCMLVDSLAILFGDPASGKTLIAIDWAACIATGAPWNDKPVEQGPVVIIAGEGHFGYSRRLKAWGLAHDMEAELAESPLLISNTATAIMDDRAFEEMIKTLQAVADQHDGKLQMVVIDTLARNIGPGDEDSSKDIAEYYRRCDHLRLMFGCTVLTVHHSGHADKNRSRGSSNIKGSTDTEYKLEAFTDESRKLTCLKLKDGGPIPEPTTFTLDQIELPWITEYGDQETSVVLTQTDDVFTPRAKPMPGGVKLGVESLAAAIQHKGIEPPKHNSKSPPWEVEPPNQVAHLDDWREFFYVRHTGESTATKRQAFNRARAEMVKHQAAGMAADCYWLTAERCPQWPEIQAINLLASSQDPVDV
ncbi:MAG: AAA family ATPase [Candidatus Thiodiazotropha sp. (ex Ctena orbiculata)]|nr:AAA family ATPase [Candidatus Thiodiazotropha taylori]